MTVSNSQARHVYVAGEGASPPYPIDFPFHENDHVAVTHRDAAGVETPWFEDSDYTLAVAPDGSGGTLTVLPGHALIAGESLVIARTVPLTQEADYQEAGRFPAESHERALDKLTMIAQQLSEALGRSLSVPTTDQAEGLALPIDADRAGRFLAFDGEGRPIAAAGTSADLEPVSAFMAGLLDASDAAGARATLGAVGLNESNVFTRTQSWAKGADIASASTLATGSDGNTFDVTGTTAITAIAPVGIGTVIKLHFNDALTLTHHATNLVLPGGADIATAAGDEAEFVEYAEGGWRCTSYVRAATAPLAFASQAEMEAGASTGVAVTPGRQQYHQSAAKAWAVVAVSGGTPSLADGYNVSSTITDHGTGDFTITFTTPFADANYVVIGSAEAASSGSTGIRGVSIRNGGRAAGSCRVYVGANAGLEDIDFTVAFFGHQ